MHKPVNDSKIAIVMYKPVNGAKTSK